jgi:O-methyltransferase
MTSPAHRPRFVFPWTARRRHAEETAELRRQLAAVQEQLRSLTEREAHERRRAWELAKAVTQQAKELDAARVALRKPSMNSNSSPDALFQKALEFDYYWYNADKKIDLRDIEGFGPIAAQVRQRARTFLHFDRLYTLWQAVGAMPSSASAVVEIGSYRGGSARFIAESMRAHDRELPFYVCDTFDGHVVVDESVDGNHRAGKQFTSTDAERVNFYLEMFPTVRVIAGDIRQTSTAMHQEHQFGLVHIDVDVYPITRFCLEFFAPRLVAGGAIVVDDYGFTTCAGAKKAVDEFVATSRRFRMLHLLTAQAVLIAVGGQAGD